MIDKLEIINPKKAELQLHIERIPWNKFLDYGSVKIQIRSGKATLVTIENTVRMDYKTVTP